MPKCKSSAAPGPKRKSTHAVGPKRKSTATAVDSTWSTSPLSGEWNNPANWTPATIPTDTAQFGPSTQVTISLAAQPSVGQSVVNEIVFAAGAPAYTFQFNFPAPTAPALTIAGQGVVNNSTCQQSFVIASSAVTYTQPQLKFVNTASAGTANLVYRVGPTTPSSAGGGVLGFYDQSTAGSATFIITTGAGTPPQHSTVGGEVSFSDTSSAGTARFTVFGSTSTTDGDTFGNAVFHDQSTAASAEFTNVGGTVSGGDGGNTQF